MEIYVVSELYAFQQGEQHLESIKHMMFYYKPENSY